MSLADQIKPISHLKANTAEVVKEVTRTEMPMFITQNGEAKIVVQDIHSYEKTQETLALLKILAMIEADYKAGNYQTIDEVSAELQAEIESWPTE